MILLSHPMGNANVRAVADGLRAQDLLHSFHTSIAAFPGNRWDRLSQLAPLRDFARRSFSPALAEVTVQYPTGELLRMAAKKTGLGFLTAHETGPYSVDGIYRAHDRKVAAFIGKNASALRAVYAYEDGALETFRTAKSQGLTTVYDLPIAYWETGRRLMREEADRLPAWAPTLGGGIKDSDAKVARKVEELELADVVVGPGYFVMDSLPDWAATKQRVVSPFGSPPAAPASPSAKRNDGPLRVLFVGSMGQRKGLADLFAAVNRFSERDVELVVLGSPLAELSFYRAQCPNFRYEPTRSHAGVLELMAECDVFCLPSIVEGRALVMQEAMSRGLPVIITPNTGGQDLVVEEETGFLVPIRSPERIAEKIDWFVRNRGRIPEMGRAAAAHAARYTWSKYGNDVVSALSELLKPVRV